MKRKTGCDVTEFLKPRLLEPLGITSLTCSKCPGPEAVEMAGGGMRMTTEDMARFIYFVLNRGRWEGRQLLEEEWFDLACTKQIETAGDAEGHVKEWAYGYGFQCWMGSQAYPVLPSSALPLQVLFLLLPAAAVFQVFCQAVPFPPTGHLIFGHRIPVSLYLLP